MGNYVDYIQLACMMQPGRSSIQPRQLIICHSHSLKNLVDAATVVAFFFGFQLGGLIAVPYPNVQRAEADTITVRQITRYYLYYKYE